MLRIFFIFSILFTSTWSVQRAYFFMTDGFSRDAMTMSFPEDHKNSYDLSKIQEVTAQPYHYLGKGCQSYVFESEDGKYVLKLIKTKHFKIPFWEQLILPKSYLVEKRERKERALNHTLSIWRLVNLDLKESCGIVYVQAGCRRDIDHTITLFDKLGKKHIIALGDQPLMIQRKATMLKEALLEEEVKGFKLIDQFLQLSLDEYKHGIVDRDFAAMQNTGVLNGRLIHIDVGQFERVQEIDQDQDLFDKSYHLRGFLERNRKDLREYLDQRLYQLMGEKLYTLTPSPKVKR